MIELGIVIAITVALTELAKKTLGVTSRYTPLIALLIGIALTSLSFGGFDTEVLLNGIVAGLSASGLYSGGKTAIGK